MILKGSGHLSEDEESQRLTPSQQVSPAGASEATSDGGGVPWSATVAKTAKSGDR